jgi:predicted transposase YbfD/YdcC
MPQMPQMPHTTIEQYFGDLPDPRRAGRTLLHPLLDLLTIALLAVICGADDWVAVHDFGVARVAWLKTFLSLPHGIPSHDTFGRVFALLRPEELQRRYVAWIRHVARLTAGEHVALDGKVLRGSADAAWGQDALVMLSAYASTAGLVLAQVAVPEDTNEIAVLPALLQLLGLSGCVVTVDAAHCQTENARLITAQGGDYVFALKANQGTLFERLEHTFEHTDYHAAPASEYTTVEKGHGRRERRQYAVLTAPDYLAYFDPEGHWAKLKSVIRVERQRTLGETSERQVHYYIASRAADAQTLARYIRSHWEIENQVHWLLDVTFREDDQRARAGFQPENLALLRHLALNLLKRESSLKRSIKGKRFTAALDPDYLLKVLQAGLA